MCYILGNKVELRPDKYLVSLCLVLSFIQIPSERDMPHASIFKKKFFLLVYFFIMYFFGSILNNREYQKTDHYGGI